MQLREYQKEKIYDPVVEIIDSSLSNPPFEKIFNILALATGSGKTTVIAKFCFAHALSKGCDIIYTNPNAASLDEVFDICLSDYRYSNIIMEKSFTGKGQLNLTDDHNIILCHPTVLSQNVEAFECLEDRNVVVFSDEAHKGFMCPSAVYSRQAFGYPIPSYEAQWHNCINEIPNIAWFLISATPLQTTYNHSMFRLASEFYEKDVLCERQKACKSVTYIGQDDLDGHEAAMNEKFKQDDQFLEDVTQKYDLPQTKPTRLIQEVNTYHALNSYNNYFDHSAICIATAKRAKHTGTKSWCNRFQFSRSYEVFKHINDMREKTHTLIANRLIGEAVNIPNATCIVSYQSRPTIQCGHATQGVEQLFGRMLRWPNVEGLDCWEDVFEFVENKISQGADRKEMYDWVDLVFKYEIHVRDSWINMYGVDVFLNKHTYNIDAWEEYLQRIISKVQNKPKTRKKYGMSEATPHAQSGPEAYKNYKDTHRRCELEECPCYSMVESGFYSEMEYFTDLEVHHKDGNRLNNDPSNLMTVCSMAHNKLEREKICK